MKTDIQISNEAITPNSHELNILKKYFPQCFSKPDTDENGNIIKEHFDIEKLTELLNKDEVDIKKEGFTLNFLGKSYAHYQSNLDSETVIVPDEKNAETNSENVYIVGDNLDALQHLKYSYAEKIKCIYIDPPYNTGKDDFVYNDKFGFTAKELVEKLDVSEEEAERICSMNGKCTHSAWLTFMYPRLALARELLRDDGVIFISIDDNEQANLKRVCDEVFGEGNFVDVLHWKRKKQPSFLAKHTAKLMEYVLVYAKNSDMLGKLAIETLSDATKKVVNLTNSESVRHFEKGVRVKCGNSGVISKGIYKIKTMQIEYLNDVHYERGRTVNSVDVKALFSVSQEKIDNFIKDDLLFITVNMGLRRDVSEEEKNGQKSITDLLLDWGDNQDSEKEINELFESKVFDYSKPTKFVRNLVLSATNITTETPLGVSNPCESQAELASRHFATQKSPGGVAGVSPAEGVAENRKVCSEGETSPDIILDFFSGSGTTAHAVMDLNASDNGNRKFIMVQLNESVRKGSEAEKAGYKTIDEIGRERIRRAAAKIKAEHPDTTADLGFKTYYLKSMPKETLDKIKTFDPNALISSDGNIVKSLGEQTLLQTWQIKDGFGFNAVPQKIDLSGYTAYLLDDEKIGKYLYLLGEIEEKSIKELIRKIENLELTVDKIFIYGYSFDFNMLTSITTNLKTLKNRNPLEPIVRY